MKFALTAFPEAYKLPERPAGASRDVADAHKQTQFLLGDDLALFERGMNTQLRIVAANKKARNAGAAAILPLWSRAFSHLADTSTLVFAGSYVSCPPLLRTAFDCIAVQRSLIADGYAEHGLWFAEAVSQAKEHQALAFDLGRYRAASALVEDDQLGAAYRLMMDLSMPHFGSTALLVAPETGLERMPVAFADNTFHLGWGELIVGWMLLAARAQIGTLCRQDALLLGAGIRDEIEGLARQMTAAIENPRRCRAEDVDGRFLIHNFRRTAGGQPRRVML
jgi:hypothetical protein